MGKFVGTKRKDTINSLVSGLKERLDNPYYLSNEASPTIVNYYSTNLERTTLDQGIKTEYEQIGKNSPFKYNLIKDFYIYGGLDHIDVDLNVEDVTGLEASPIINRSVILPNMGMIPAVGDHFEIPYMDNPYVFEITSVNTDKLEDQSNMYEIEHELIKNTNEELMKQVAGTFIMDIDNIGTNRRVIIREDAHNLIDILDEAIVSLKNYYLSIFFSPRVETFIFDRGCGTLFYDPHLIEFLIRNDILAGSGEYLHVTQQMSPDKSFAIDYDNTFFRSLEVGSVNKLKGNVYGWGKHIDQITSVLSIHQEDYFEIKYVTKDDITINPKFNIFSEDLIRRIKENDLYESEEDIKEEPIEEIDDPEGITEDNSSNNYAANVSIDTTESRISRGINNIIIRYFNDFDISSSDIDLIEDINYYNGGMELFYMIPILIFIIEKYILRYLHDPERK